MVPKTVLTRSGPISLNAARPINIVKLRTSVNNAGPMKNVINNAYSTDRRPFNKITSTNNRKGNLTLDNLRNRSRFRTNRTRVNTARLKADISIVKGNKGNVVKASACWVWRPKHKVLDHVSRNNGASISFKRFDYIDVQGKSKSIMKKLMEDLLSLEEIPNEGKLLGKKNNVLFTDTACVVLSPDFKLTDERHVLLKVPRKDNMYSADLNNVVPQGGIENLIDLRVKVVRCDNGTKFKNRVMNQFCEMKGRKPVLSFMRPFGCPVTILNTIDHLGKFDGKADERFFIGYSTNSKAFRVFNSRTRIVEENMHVKFSEDTPNIAGSGPNWLFDINALTYSMNYKPVVVGNQSNGNAGTKACDDTGKTRMETVPRKDYILLPLWTQDPLFSSNSKDSPDAGFKPSGEEEKKDVKDLGNEDSEVPSTEEPRVNQEKDTNVNNTNNINTVSPADNAAGIKDNAIDENIVYGCADDPNMPDLEEIGRFSNAKDDDSGADMNNLDTYFQTLVELPNGKRAIGIKWVFRNKNDERGIVIKNKARLVAQGYTQEEGIDYDKVFAPIDRIKAIRLFLGYASFKDFMVYQMDVKSAFFMVRLKRKSISRAWYETLSTYLLDNEFQRGKIDKTLFIKRDKSDILLVQKEDGIFISQDKYMNEILNKFGFSDVKTASTPMDTHKTLLKYIDGEVIDEHLYRSMIGSLMYLTFSRPDIMFADSPFDLVAYTDGDYAGTNLDRKSTTGAEYIVASNCCRQSTICIVKNPVFHSKTKYIEIRHHFIRDSSEKKLIQMIKIHTDKNVVDLLTKAFDVSKFQYLIASIGMLNL
ncbi:putative ribonuclease H-like domain-containing protein [Tanacetum coccineum]|uniref:Ribonuclease H-like domain-containing protein n=1 Tax=Tanacetum coccineum TaxID=301880 RepID=A0ABQ5IAH6_9ASTR